MTGVRPSGRFVLEYTRPDGQLGWVMDLRNGVTTEGVNHLLDAGFRGASRYAAWYLGLIDGSGYSALSAADTHAAHAGWGEFAGVYLSQRVAWTPSAAAGGVVVNPAQAQAQVTAAGTVRGAFLASRQAVGTGGGNVLYATAAAAAGLAVEAGGLVRVTYTVRLRPSS